MNNVASSIYAPYNGLSVPTRRLQPVSSASELPLQPAPHSSEVFFQSHVNLIFLLFYATILFIVSSATFAIYLYNN